MKQGTQVMNITDVRIKKIFAAKKQHRTLHLAVNLESSSSEIGEGNGNPLQYPCLENSMDRGAWRVTVQGVAKSRT